MAIDSKSGWADIPAEFTERCVFMDIIGLENSGKTSLALSAPGPIALIHAAEKIKGVANAVVKGGKRIREHKYGFIASGDKVKDATAAAPVWQGVRDKYIDAYGWARTTIFDTGNNLWEMIRYARLGTTTPKGNRMDALYGPLNMEFRSLLQNRYRNQSKCNVVTIHHMGDQYIDKMKDGTMQSVRTGKVVRKGGFKEIPFIADVVVECYRGNDGEFLAKIKKGWYNAGVENIELSSQFMEDMGYTADPVTNSALNFSSIMAFISDAPQSEWLK